MCAYKFSIYFFLYFLNITTPDIMKEYIQTFAIFRFYVYAYKSKYLNILKNTVVP